MSEPDRSHELVTRWELEATPDEVFSILDEPTALMRWWPSVYLEVTEVDPGGADGVGRVSSFLTKGWLPNTLRWSSRITSAQRPSRIELDAFGDLEGHGVWALEAIGSSCVVTFQWTVRAGSALLRPLFAANFGWAMARGRESLALELRRRRAETPDERAKIPDPPVPTPRTALPLLLGTVGAIPAVAGAAVLWRRRPHDF